MKLIATKGLTNSQMKIWTGQSHNQDSPLYNMVLIFRINGKIIPGIFKSAFQKLVDTNDVLRLKIKMQSGIPEQHFYDEVKDRLNYIDLSKEDNPNYAYGQWVNEHKLRLFDHEDLLYEAVLFKLTDTAFIFYFNQHHLITDGWSMKYLFNQLSKNYLGLIGSIRPNELKTGTYLSYADKNQYSHLEDISPFWQTRLDKQTAVPSLYGTKPTPNSSRATRVTLNLGKNRTRKLKELANDSEIRGWNIELALYNIFLTATAILIKKVGDKNEFAVGVPYHNRFNANDRNTAGLFMELFPITIGLEEGETFISLLQRVKNESLEVIKNSIEHRPPVALLKNFNTLLNFIPVSFGDFAEIPTACEWLLADHTDANHPLRLQIHDFNDEGDYKLLFDLNHDVFSKDQMGYVGKHFIKILDAFMANKNESIAHFNLTTQEELYQIEQWNNTTVPIDEAKNLLSKFYGQVLKTPNATALEFDGKTMTYEILDKKSNQVAQFLLKKGVKRNEIITVSLERSLDMMVYIYGIVKAGAAYLPVDTAIPLRRLRFIVNNAGSKIIFYNHTKLNAQAIEGLTLYSIDTIANEISLLKNERPSVTISSNDLAYVIYTSGSTGEPKGVKCHHRGVCNRLNWMNTYYPITHNDTFIQKTPITFDVSVWELFWPLQEGAKLIIEVPEGHKDPDGLIKTILKNKVTVIHFVPSMLNIFIGTPKVERCTSLKRIFCSGEVLSPDAVNATYTKLNVAMYNLYGPTEASIDVTTWHCKKNHSSRNIPIGYPVANTKLYILDDKMNPLPIGVAGELYIGGVQVAHGYLNNKSLTEQRFVKDIFSSNPDATMYKTGDLAKYGPDGAILYLGRADNQVKLHGLRIELGEIEKNIEAHNDIVQAVVVLDKIHTNFENLVAFYSGKKIPDDHIQSLLKENLPTYMIPSFFIHVKGFSLTSSGKVDRKKLPKASIDVSPKTTTYLEPINEIEEIIVAVWKEVLLLEKISTNDNFVQIGGNSLNALVVTSKLREAFELELTITDIFTYPKVTTYAKYVEETITELMNN